MIYYFIVEKVRVQKMQKKITVLISWFSAKIDKTPAKIWLFFFHPLWIAYKRYKKV